jgi:hypothetical protein
MKARTFIILKTAQRLSRIHNHHWNQNISDRDYGFRVRALPAPE